MSTYLPYRAQVYCSLGELISGQFADTYLQQAGLVLCRGSIELAGIYRPTIGTSVTFAYTRGGSTAARIPRRLRVLSSFADPFTKRTSVQIGCKLSLLADNRQPDKATPEETNPSLPTGWQQYFAAPVRASAVAEKCLDKLGITAADTIPLTNRFTQDFIDLSTGYVEVLGRLLESECYVGWLNDEEELQIRSLIASGMAAGPVFNNTNVFTLSPIGSATLPAEAVTVVYDPQRLKPFSVGIGTPNTLGEASGWTRSISFGLPAPYSIIYEGGSFSSSYIPVQETVSEFGNSQLVQATTTSFKPLASIAGKYASQALSVGVPVSLLPVPSKSQTVNTYDNQGRVAESIVSELVSTAEFAGNLDLTFFNSSTDFVIVPTGGEIERERTITRYLYSDGYVRREVQRYQNWALTQAGQQAVNESRGALATTAEVSSYINSLIGAPVYVGSELNITDSGPQSRSVPGPATLTRQAYGKSSSRDSVSTTEYIFGSSSSERTITFTLPYTGDDYVSIAGTVGTPVAGSELSKTIALNYGRLQNRLRLGNAQGVSLQVPVELLPTNPFDALYLQADNLTGQYRANGMSWTFDGNGIMGQLDALFWQATGQTGTPGAAWFPLPPGVSSLPTTPSTTVNGSPVPANSGSLPGGWDPAAPDLTALFGALPTGAAAVFPMTLNVEAGLLPFTETVALDGVTRSVLSVVDRPYSLAPQSADADMVTTALFVGAEIVIVRVPLVALTLTPLVTAVTVSVLVPVVSLTLQVLSPDANTGPYLRIPAISLTFTTLLPAGPVAVIIVSAITYLQSTVWTDNEAATNATMTNSSAAETLQTGTNIFGDQWVRMDFGSVYSVARVFVGTPTASLAGEWGETSEYTDGRDLQYSTDGTSWTTERTLSGLAAGAVNELTVSFSARYVRIFITDGYIALTEFYATSS